MERRSILRSSGKLSNLTMESILKQSTTTKLSSRKKSKFKEAIISGNDRISNLPEPILDHILSFLDTSQVVQTSILSKTWRTIYKTLSFNSLQFDYKTFCSITGRDPKEADNLEKFLDSVMRLIKKCQPIQIHRFRFSCDSRPETYSGSNPNIWRLFHLLVNCRVQHLDVDLKESISLVHIFTFKYLTVLKLNLNMEELFPFCLPTSMCLPSLKTLHFQSVCFCQGTNFFMKFFSKCPLLSTLIMTDCGMAIEEGEHVIISSTLLKHFEIDSINEYYGIDRLKMPCKITICTPNLISFKCRSDIANKYSLENLSSLKDAEIIMELSHISQLTMQQKKEFGTEMVKLLGGLCNAGSIRVSGLVLEVIGQDIEVFVKPFHALRHLKMRTWLSRDSLKAIHCLLHQCDKVETLSIEVIEPEVDLGKEKPVFFSDCKLCHLRVFNTKGIQGFKEEVEFLKGVLKSACNLEELVVVKRNHSLGGSEKRLEDMKETLLAFPRDSNIIKIQIF